MKNQRRNYPTRHFISGGTGFVFRSFGLSKTQKVVQERLMTIGSLASFHSASALRLSELALTCWPCCAD